jgi:inosose dehydratase
MLTKLDRRDFFRIASAGAIAGSVSCTSETDPRPVESSQPGAEQKFIAGYAPFTDGTVESFWQVCDECSALGFRYVETDNTRLKIVQAYENRTSEFKDEMDKRGLTLLGLGQFTPFSDPARREEAIAQQMGVARFLQAVGGRYINAMFQPRPNPDVPREKLWDSISEDETKTFADLANVIGKQMREETGIRNGYHAEREECRIGLFRPIMEMTNPDYFDMLLDVGHMTSGGQDALAVAKTYRARIIGCHFKDYDPNLEWERNGRTGKGSFVELGRGIVDFPALVAFLKETDFDGFVMGEIDGRPKAAPVMHAYMVDALGLKV